MNRCERLMAPLRVFVLMPVATPYGRILPDITRRNYKVIIETVEKGGC